MQKMEIKISNIFKEKKKDNNRINCKEITKDIYFEENINKNFISLLNKKRKQSNSRDKNFKKIKNNNILDNIINIKEDLNINNKNNIFELSEKTKNILKKIEAKIKLDKNKHSKTLNITTCKNNSPPKLSLKTFEIIQKIHEEKKNQFNKQSNTDKLYNNLNSSYNLHLKYDELLSTKRELRLPIKYKELLNTFNHLEQIINLNKIKNQSELNTFDKIKINIESMTNNKFDINIFKQILYIVPHFYIFKYINSNKFQETFSLNENLDRNYDLLIDIPNDFSERIKKNYSNDFNFLEINYCSQASDSFTPIMTSLTEKEMNIRKSIFHNILNYIVNDYHSKYLKENKIKIKFNPLTQKTWHHNFDPDKYCKAIPLFDLPSPPEYKCVFVETINKNDIKNQISSIKYDEIKSSTKVSSSSASKFVSEDYIKKIRAKEQALNIVKEINNYNYYYNYKNDKNKMIKNMLLQMKTLLMTHKSSLELNVLSDLIINSDRAFKDFFENTQKLNQVIINFSKNYEGFINISNHSRLGPIVVLINNEYNIPDIFNKIE